MAEEENTGATATGYIPPGVRGPGDKWEFSVEFVPNGSEAHDAMKGRNHATRGAAAPIQSPYLSAREAAAYLRLPSVDALYARVARGGIKPKRFGRSYLFTRVQLDNLTRPKGR